MEARKGNQIGEKSVDLVLSDIPDLVRGGGPINDIRAKHMMVGAMRDYRRMIDMGDFSILSAARMIATSYDVNYPTERFLVKEFVNFVDDKIELVASKLEEKVVNDASKTVPSRELRYATTAISLVLRYGSAEQRRKAIATISGYPNFVSESLKEAKLGFNDGAVFSLLFLSSRAVFEAADSGDMTAWELLRKELYDEGTIPSDIKDKTVEDFFFDISNSDPIVRRELSNVILGLNGVRNVTGVLNSWDSVLLPEGKKTREKMITSPRAIYGRNLETVYKLSNWRQDSVDIPTRVFKIRNYGRYPEELLKRQVENMNRRDLNFVVMAGAAGDWNGASYQLEGVLERSMMDLIDLGYDFVLTEAESKAELIENLFTLKHLRGGKNNISLVILSGHGYKEGMVYGEGVDGRVTVKDIKRPESRRFSQALINENIDVVYLSCYGGVSGGLAESTRDNLGLSSSGANNSLSIGTLHFYADDNGNLKVRVTPGEGKVKINTY